MKKTILIGLVVVLFGMSYGILRLALPVFVRQKPNTINRQWATSMEIGESKKIYTGGDRYVVRNSQTKWTHYNTNDEKVGITTKRGDKWNVRYTHE